MKTNTKILATLGIVSGLGIAALPAMSYAADVSGDAKIETEITPAIAMRIHSNADVACTDAQDPSTCTDTYGVTKYNPETAKSAGEPDSADGPSLATGLKLSANQKDLTTLYSNVEVRSNTGKFQLTLADNDTDTRLNLTPVSTEANQYIETADGEPEAASASWAVQGGDISEWSAMPASDATPLTILNNGTNPTSPLDFSAAVTVNYGVSSGQTKTGAYSNVVTYTAIANTDNVASGDSTEPADSLFVTIPINDPSKPNSVDLAPGENKTFNIEDIEGYYIFRVSDYEGGYYDSWFGINYNAKTLILRGVNDSRAGSFTLEYRRIPDEIAAMTFPSEPTDNIQNFNCSSALPNIYDTTLLRDTRDGKTYRVAKLTDGKCWTLDNMAITGPRTLTPADSSATSNVILPALNSGSIQYGARGTESNVEYGTDVANAICPKGWNIGRYDLYRLAYDEGESLLAPQLHFYDTYNIGPSDIGGFLYLDIPYIVTNLQDDPVGDWATWVSEGSDPRNTSGPIRCVAQ